ncbi:MAG: DUF523 domain-containing protein [Methanocella sp.]|jgi:uncharacterized protein YbbK (DUF523 family)
MKLVSACLLGINCNFEGKNKLQPQLLEEFKKGELYPICPEVLGGLSIPRIPAEIQGGDGLDVIEGKAYVVNMQGIDVTDEFMKGAYEVLRIAEVIDAKEALLVERSPSCGCGEIFDGTFTGKLKSGDGVTAALLKKKGIKVTCIKAP